MAKLSILIPVYNEEATILSLVDRVRTAPLSVEKEILIGDDGSTDGTRRLLEQVRGQPGIHVEFMERNVGRGGVLKYLWTRASGEFLIHQDADLEYDPTEYEKLLRPILHNEADVVYGSRFLGSVENMRWMNNLGNRLMTTTCRLVYGMRITDLMTCYKLYRADLIRDLTIQSDRFDFEAELTARFAQRGARFTEVPISFVGRSIKDGKKIRAYDALFVMRRLVGCKLSKG